MFGLPKILAPVDFSQCSSAATRYAGRLTRHFRAEFTLLHVLDSTVYELSAGEAADPAIRKLSDGWRSRTEELLAQLPDSEVQDMNIRRIVLSGRPGEVIVAFARFERMSLIVIPTRGYEPFRRCLLGSVVSRVLNDAECPVLTGVHGQEGFPNELGGIRKILCAVDLCPESLKALVWASQFAQEFQAQLTIAHITPSTEGGVGEYFNPDRRRSWVTESRHDDFSTQARQRIAEMQKLAGANAAVVLASSMDVPRAVCSAASQAEADLVVVGRGSSTGVERLRTKVYSIVRQSPCHVVCVRNATFSGCARRRSRCRDPFRRRF